MSYNSKGIHKVKYLIMKKTLADKSIETSLTGANDAHTVEHLITITLDSDERGIVAIRY